MYIKPSKPRSPATETNPLNHQAEPMMLREPKETVTACATVTLGRRHVHGLFLGSRCGLQVADSGARVVRLGRGLQMFGPTYWAFAWNVDSVG